MLRAFFDLVIESGRQNALARLPVFLADEQPRTCRCPRDRTTSLPSVPKSSRRREDLRRQFVVELLAAHRGAVRLLQYPPSHFTELPIRLPDTP